MTGETLISARQELMALKASLEQDPRYKRMLILERFIHEIEAIELPRPATRTRINPARTSDSNQVSSLKSRPKVDRVKEIALNTVKLHGFATKNQILKEVRANGIDVSDAAMSAYLSRFEEFVPDRTKGWSLKLDVTNNGLSGSGNERAEVAASAFQRKGDA